MRESYVNANAESALELDILLHQAYHCVGYQNGFPLVGYDTPRRMEVIDGVGVTSWTVMRAGNLHF